MPLMCGGFTSHAPPHLPSQPSRCKALPWVGSWGGVRLRVAQFLANFWQEPCMLVYYTSASATVPQPGLQATGTSGHCLCHLLGTAEELGEAAQAPE
jgi:hypothetical protein